MLNNQSQWIDWCNLRRLAFAMLFSLLLHLLMLDNFNWRWIDANALDHDEIHVELMPPPTESTITTHNPEVAKVAYDTPPKPVAKASHASVDHDVVETNAVSIPVDNPLVQIAPQSDNALATSDQSAEQPTESLGNENSTANATPPKDDSAADLSTEQLNQLPTQIDIVFDVLYNGKIGEAEVHFRRSTDGHYRLTSERHATGVAAVFVKSKDQETSEGLVTSTGLNPTRFTRQFGKDGNKLHHAEFDWATAKLTLQENSTNSVVDLPIGTQDMLSFMYQFMFVPPLTEMQVSITNGRKLNQYAYRFEGEEEIQTSLGKVKTLHIAKNSNEGDGKLDLWLGIDYHYLPMKIRKIDKNDKVYEQVISKLDTK